MNAKTLATALLVALWGICADAQGQSDAPAPGIESPPIRQAPPTPENLGQPNVLPGGGPPLGPVPANPSGLSDWILYRRPDCCSAGPPTPIYSELYLRVGPSIPVGGTFTGRELLVGWTLEGGVRGMFFNPAMTSAWIIDAGIVNTNNGARNPGTPITLSIIQPGPAPVFTPTLGAQAVTMQNYNRTFASLGFGKDWYPWQPANSPDGTWRIGFDTGGRYGSASMTFNEIRHRTHSIYGAYLAGHTEYEIPCGCCIISWGLRCEWAYTEDYILQRGTYTQDINALVTFNVRY
jgi:hypothetical protein